MNKVDRAMIDRCCDYLTPRINMLALWPKLVERRVFNPDDVNASRWEENLSAEETARDILLATKTRGPEAFRNLVLCLRETKHGALADVLQGYRPIDPDNSGEQTSENEESDGNADDELDNDGYHKNLRFNRQPLEVKVRKATKFRDHGNYKTIGRYPMRSRPRGFILLITVKKTLSGDTREAVERDQVCLVKLFEQMGFEVSITADNLTGAEILEAIEKFSKRDFRLVDCCFVIISAHGHAAENAKGVLDTEFAGSDYGLTGARKVFSSNIIDFFTVENCPLLNGKPKIFIFQSCRGEKRHKIPKIDTDGIQTGKPPRNYSDILIANSTMHGFVSFRDNVSGSWYMQILCEVFMNYAHRLHIQELFQMVDTRLANQLTEVGHSQTSTLKSLGFNKHCYLNPGLFEDSNS